MTNRDTCWGGLAIRMQTVTESPGGPILAYPALIGLYQHHQRQVRSDVYRMTILAVPISLTLRAIQLRIARI
jgi:hypothetical protein